MKYLDQVYSNKEGKVSENLSFEEKCLAYQRKIEESLKTEYQDKVIESAKPSNLKPKMYSK